MTIDWSKAPDGATHWDPIDENWLRQFSGIALGWLTGKGWTEKGRQYPNNLSTMPRLVARPAWTGEGLPLPGTTIERLDIHANWVRAEVAYVGTDRVVLRDSSGQEFVPKLQEFNDASEWRRYRPLRTAEQVTIDQLALEERKRVIDEMFGSVSFSDADEARRICSELCDKGYRKQVTP